LGSSERLVDKRFKYWKHGGQLFSFLWRIQSFEAFFVYQIPSSLVCHIYVGRVNSAELHSGQNSVLIMAVKFGFVKEAAFQLIPWQVGLIIRKVKAM